ncbi:TetR/AcrR family transcriptional regulator [Kytococcus sp. HMSC28H12]|uniref:TetR/AcrR family transcriptional regulator n=1 Tax=Kytococcus sp. HMSC28H12 TaxID=1581067 RepID=UPI0008A57FF9|nr:TetR/AcrR family transcriptional regulator [Kytococcus sp. HMSC28H12]OFS06917.1 hypothetical protein HMPREF3099_10745 [Kytococcus sp. HMSC28H12]
MPSSTPPNDPAGPTSLRERRRRETWAALHRAAAEAALSGDATASSVEAIAATAGVSTRTFFNYFTSKDEAVYGYTEPHVPTEALERMGPSGDPVAQATELLLATMRTSTPEGTPALRKQLIQTNPALGRFRLQALARSEDLVVAALESRFADDPRLADAPGGPAHALRMWASLAGAVLRHATTDPDHVPGEALTPAAVRRSIDLFHHLLRSPE